MNQSESINEICGALVDVQAELPSFAKNAQGYGYRYTDLDTIVSTVKPILYRHGLAFMQSVTKTPDNKLSLTTRIFSRGGQFIEDTMLLPEINGEKNKVNAAQAAGMAITYMRRYTLCAMLGITSDEDLDASTQSFQNGGQRPPQRQNAMPPQRQMQAQRQMPPQNAPQAPFYRWTGEPIGKRM